MSGADILVVDDSQMNLKLCRTILELEGFQVRTARDAEEAQVEVAAGIPDLVLMDIGLPGMDGLELTRRLRERPEMAQTPIVAVTGYAMKGDEERMRQAGCDGYVAKPIDITHLLEVVRAKLRPDA